jgi:hypothetical protein
MAEMRQDLVAEASKGLSKPDEDGRRGHEWAQRGSCSEADMVPREVNPWPPHPSEEDEMTCRRCSKTISECSWCHAPSARGCPAPLCSSCIGPVRKGVEHLPKGIKLMAGRGWRSRDSA